MQPAELPNNEIARVAILQGTNLLDSPIEASFDALTESAARLCNTPLSSVCLVDSERIWFKSSHGLEGIQEIPREIGFCSHTINQEEIFEIQDAFLDPRFNDNPIVINNPNLRYYAGIPLVTDDGFALGTLCVMDYKPRKLNPSQIENLKDLATAAAALIEAKRLKQMRAMSIEHRLGEVVEISPVEIFLVDSKSEKFTYANRAALYNLGYSLDQLKQLHWHDVLVDTPANITDIKTLPLHSLQSMPLHLQARQRRQNGSEYPVDCVFQRYSNEHNEFLIISNDSSQRKQAEEKTQTLMDNLTHITRLNTLNALASGLAHELSQPFTAIKQYCDTALYITENQPNKSDTLIESIKQTNTQIVRASEIVKRFRAFSGNGKTNHEKINAQLLIDETLSLCSQDIKKHAISLTIDTPGKPLFFHADPIQIQQVLLNLVSNSIQAMEQQHDNKKITISCHIIKSGYIEFSITDSGPGINEFELENLTIPTPSNKPNGTGLGLCVCNFIVCKHNGNFWHDKSHTHGAKIVFEIPITTDELC